MNTRSFPPKLTLPQSTPPNISPRTLSVCNSFGHVGSSNKGLIYKHPLQSCLSTILITQYALSFFCAGSSNKYVIYEDPQRHEASFLPLVSLLSSHSRQSLHQRPCLQQPFSMSPVQLLVFIRYVLICLSTISLSPALEASFRNPYVYPGLQYPILIYTLILPFHYPHESLPD